MLNLYLLDRRTYVLNYYSSFVESSNYTTLVYNLYTTNFNIVDINNKPLPYNRNLRKEYTIIYQSYYYINNKRIYEKNFY